MAAIAAAEAPVSKMALKRERGDVYLQESENSEHKRPRLSEFLFEEDTDSLGIIEDETLLHVMKSLEEEISTTPEKSADNVDVGKIEASSACYEYLFSATDDELGIPPSPPAPLDENDGQHISQNLWSDLLENSSDQKANLLQPFLTYCYSNNYRDFEVYGIDIPDSDGQEWFVDEASSDVVLNECMTLFQ